MRIFFKILSILFVIVFIFSVTTSVVLGLSSTTILANSNDKEARRHIYYTSLNKLSSSKNITIISTMPYSKEEGYISKDKITCSLNNESLSESYSCTMISQLFDDSSKIVRTSYFPGDGYKYSLEGDIKSKTIYSNNLLSTYFLSLLAGATTYVSYLAFNQESIDAYSINYKHDSEFDFNTFSILKNIAVNFTVGSNTQKIDFTFDKNDYLTKLTFGKDSSLQLSYKKANITFPSFNGFDLV